MNLSAIKGLISSPKAILTCQYGCKDYFWKSDEDVHKRVCPLRKIRCPSCFKSIPSINYKTHFRYAVEDSDYIGLFLSRGPFLVNVKINGEMYILMYTYDSISGVALFNLKYTGPIEHSNRLYFKLLLIDSKKKVYEYRKQVSNLNSWKLEDYAIKVDINSLDVKQFYYASAIVTAAIKVENRIPEFPKEILKILLRDISCNLCGNCTDESMFQEVSGYSICKKCNNEKSNINKMRNLALEYISENLIKNRSEESNRDGLLKALECPVCLEYLHPPIKNCVIGHSLCGSCRPLLTLCPICKDMFSCIRNLNVESIYYKMHYKCVNFDNGCLYSNLPQVLRSHENECQWTKCKNTNL